MAGQMLGVVYHRNNDENPSSVTSITIPNTVTSIGNKAFMGYRSLASITFPPTITSLGNSVFLGCASLMSIALPHNLISIGDQVFVWCTALKDITLPYNLISLGNGCFAGCTSLTSINLPLHLRELGDDVFARCTSLTSITLPPNLIKTGNRVFVGCKSLTFINLPSLPEHHQYFRSSLLLFADAVRTTTPENKAIWTRTKNEDNRLPLMIAAAISLKWKDMERIFNANKGAIYEMDDAVTGLPVSLLAAAGPGSDLESLYHLCKENPPAVKIMQPSHNPQMENNGDSSGRSKKEARGV